MREISLVCAVETTLESPKCFLKQEQNSVKLLNEPAAFVYKICINVHCPDLIQKQRSNEDQTDVLIGGDRSPD